jgi:hypothetical protein
MIGGKGRSTAYFPCLSILAHGPGNSGGREIKFIDFRNMLSLNMTTCVFALVDLEPCTRG